MEQKTGRERLKHNLQTGIKFLRNQHLPGKAAVIILFIAAFFSGRAVAVVISPGKGSETQAVSSTDADENAASGEVTVSASQQIAAAADGNWGLSFQKEGEKPVANATYEELAAYNAWYAQDTEEKIIYLTFDCGYENGNTPAILAALKKHSVPATFFVVGNFLAENPDLIRQMIAEGHTVGNHTYHHPDMSQISDIASFQEELEEVEQLFLETTGQEISRYYRPPQGKYSEANLEMAKELGYQTFFWSLAYVDWYQDDQPTKEEAFEKLLGRIHPGAIVLLHNTSSTNGEILDELLTKWEEMGYRFGRLGDLAGT
jgi:peptidoglycan-N-acetylmuramic acid deacetylase